MKHKLLFTFLSLSILALLPQTIHAGAWTAKKGGMYHKVAFNYYKASDEFDSNGNKQSMQNNGEFTDSNLSYYGEYGLGEGITVFGSLSYKTMRKKDGTAENDVSGVGDIDIGLRYRIWEKSSVFSVQGLLKIPSGYDKDESLPLGNGQVDAEMRLLYGRSLYPAPMYFGLEFGYRYRANEPSDEWKYLLELGGNFTEKLYIRGKLDGTKSAKNSDTVLTASGNPAASIEYDLAKQELTVGRAFTKKWAGEFTYTQDLFGEKTSAGSTISLALILSM